MLDDLKERLAGFDKKRLYTAAAALVIAGTAGHFMQRSANSAGDTPIMAGSIPAPIPAIVPAAEPAAIMDVAAVAPAPELIEPAPQDAAPAVLASANATEPDAMAPEQIDLPTAPEALAEIAPAEVAPVEDMVITEVTRSEADPVLVIADETSADQAPDLAAAVPAVEEVVAPMAPAVEEAAPAQLAVLDDSAVETKPIETPAAPILDLDVQTECRIDLSASAMPGALVMLSLEAPCQSGGEVTFNHAGLSFSEQLDPDGSLTLVIPALQERAVFNGTFGNGDERSIELTVADVTAYERIAIVWQGATGLQLHALENGASYGESGHVWAQEPAMPNAAVEGTGGFVSVLGSTSDGYAADVYTFPVSLMVAGQEPQVSIEAQVMENTCGQKIEGSILRSNAGRAPTNTSLTMAVPDCDAVGEYLVLHNLPQDLKIALN